MFVTCSTVPGTSTDWNGVYREFRGPLLAERLRRLQKMGIIEKQAAGHGRKNEYRLTLAGEELQEVIDTLLTWGVRWVFGEPDPNELDPVLLLWWMQGRVRADQLPEERVVVQFDFCGADNGSYWLVLAAGDVSVCLQHPGFEIDLLVTADLATFYQLWLGQITYAAALREPGVEIDATPALLRGFPNWFAWSPAAATVQTTTPGVNL